MARFLEMAVFLRKTNEKRERQWVSERNGMKMRLLYLLTPSLPDRVSVPFGCALSWQRVLPTYAVRMDFNTFWVPVTVRTLACAIRTPEAETLFWAFPSYFLNIQLILVIYPLNFTLKMLLNIQDITISLCNLFIQHATIHLHLEFRSWLRNSQKFSFASQPN
jgi:hypothetical protein